MHYLMSRYYDPVTHRFVNADGYFQSGGGIFDTNMSAYCGNNPIIYKDLSGNRDCAATSVDKESRLERKISFIHQTNITNKTSVSTTNLFDVTDRLNSAMKNNAQTLNKLNLYGSICGVSNGVAISIFINNVKTGGNWDFKNQEDWNLKKENKYMYRNKIFKYDDIGNIHYGYIGRTLFDENILLLGAGAVQIKEGTSDWSYWDSNFDDPRDQAAIKYGSALWELNALG